MRYIVVDLEATCWRNERTPDRMETIEIGAVELASAAGPPIREFTEFIRPVVVPELTAFCTELTTITQADVDAADPFPVVFRRFEAWAGPGPFVFCSWGQYDKTQLAKDCARHNFALPAAFEPHVNLKTAFAAVMGVKSCGLAKALAHAGLTLEGTHHRGLDDARNIARLAVRVLPVVEAAQ